MKHFKIPLIVLCTFLLNACSHEQKQIPKVVTIATNNSNTMSFDEAIKIASNEFLQSSGNSKSRVSAEPKKIKSNEVIIDKTTKDGKTIVDTLFYIFNYEKGFAIITGDKRLPSYLGYSETGTLEKRNLDNTPGGLLIWLDDAKMMVKEFKKNNFKIASTKNGRTTTNILTSSKGPFTNTTWDQGWGYNNLVTTNCTSGGSGGKAFTGCVATSMAQIMKYWGDKTGRPLNYSWGSMPTTFGTNETQKLMRDAGVAANMNYGCSGSSTTLTKAHSALINTFKFTGGNRIAYDNNWANNTISSLFNDYPVILEGCDGGSCHAWVCDGYQQWKNPQGFYDSRRDLWLPTYYTLFRMNWGWGGSHNGWFSQIYWGADTNGNAMPYNFSSSIGGIYNLKI